jgi:hypothetical protein
MAKRKFKNRKFKHDDDFISVFQYHYTESEMFIEIGSQVGKIIFSDHTLIKKEDLKRFANELKAGKAEVLSTASNYESNPYFLAEKTQIGYRFTIKGIITCSMNLPILKVKKLINFLLDL